MLARWHGTEDTVTYTPVAGSQGSATTFDAIVGDEELERRPDARSGALIHVRVRSVWIQPANFAQSSMVLNGTLTVDSRKYAIVHVGDDSTGLYEVQLESVAPGGEVTRDGYRGR